MSPGSLPMNGTDENPHSKSPTKTIAIPAKTRLFPIGAIAFMLRPDCTRRAALAIPGRAGTGSVGQGDKRRDSDQAKGAGRRNCIPSIVVLRRLPLPVASFRQKSLLLKATVPRFRAKRGLYGHCVHTVFVTRKIRRVQAELVHPELF